MKTSKPTIWQHFVKALPLTIIAILITAVGVLAAAGTLDSPSDPGSTNSFSLEDIYQRLVNGTDGSQSGFTEPAVAPGTGTMHTINDIMAAAPEVDEEDGATPSDVLSGATFWGLTDGEWGLQTGSMAAGSDVVGEDGSLSFDIPDACYSGNSATAMDSDLNPLNITYGVNIFGVTGRYKNGWSVFDQMDSDYFLLSVDMVTATDGWAVGGPNGYHAYIYHYDGFNWTEHSVIEYLGRAEVIQMLGPDDGWIVTDGGAFLKYDGETDSWNFHSYIEDTLFTGLQMVTATEGWAITGQGKVYRYIEHTDSWIMHTDLGVYLVDIDMVSTIDGWILSMYADKIFHYDGVVDTWSEFQDVHLIGNAIDMVSATDGWLVGNAGRVFRFDGDTESWIAYSVIAGEPNLYSVVMLAANNGWIGTGDGKIYHYSGGGAWNLYDDGFPGSFLSFGVVNEGDIWAVGNTGYIYHFID